MILETILNLIYSLLQFQTSLLPSVPQMPQSIQAMLNSYIDIMVSGVGVVRYLLSSTLFDFVIGTGIALITFEYAYAFIMWILRKVPLVSID